MKKFVLIDQSITGEGGHYLSYASSVLDAAAKEGFTPVLVTNRRFVGGQLPYAVYPLFAYTTGESLLDFRVRGDGGGQSLPQYLWGGYVKPGIKRMARGILGGRISAVKQAVHGDALKNAEWEYKSACFSRDFTAAVKAISLSQADVLFVPSITTVELVGMSQALCGEALREAPTVHLLFRRNVFHGRRGDYTAELPELGELRRSFAVCEPLYEAGRLRFYTDTEELSAQYQMLSGFSFTTLPIPHTFHPKSSAWQRSKRRTAVYLGDARIEKGYLHLPQLVAGLSEDAISFQIQSNFSVPGGEGGIAACRKRLRSFPAATMHDRPLSPLDYASLLYQADFLLVLYDARAYYARSSGVFAEAMSAGIPSVVPADTWMSREVCRGRYAHLRTLVQRIESVPLFIEATRPGVTWMRRESISGKAVFRMTADWRQSGDSLRVVVTLLDSNGSVLADYTEFLEQDGQEDCLLFLALPEGCACVELTFSGTYGQTLPRLLSAEVVPLASDTQAAGPICGIFDHPSQLVPLMKNMLRDYTMLRESAQQFSINWGAFHNAQKLIEKLLPSPMVLRTADKSEE